MMDLQQNFTEVMGNGYTAIVRNGWGEFLLEDLGNNFKNIQRDDTVKIFRGRTTHFSYKPAGADKRVVVRRAKRGGFVSLLGGMYLSPSRPVSELRTSEGAISSGINTPQIVAIRITSALPFFYTFTVLTEEIENAVELVTYIRDANLMLKCKLLQKLASEIRCLHNAGIYHSDLNLRNILVKEIGSDIAIYFIDFDKTVIYNTGLSEKMRLNNISRLNRSVEKLLGKENIVTKRDRIRFLRYYGLEGEKLRTWSIKCASTLWWHKFLWSLKGKV